MTALWAGDDVIGATGGQGPDGWQATGISINADDTQPGDLFIAVQGDARTAFANGAVAALVVEALDDLAQPQIIVADTLAALDDLARAARFRSAAKIVAVTGSVGKASTIAMVQVILGGQGICHARPARYQNRLDVALWLATLPPLADYAVVKIGADQPGDIARLTRLTQPHAALVTRIAPEHLAAFGSLSAIADEKAAIFQGLAPGGCGVFHGDDQHAKQMRKSVGRARHLRFGGAGNDWSLQRVKLGEAVTVVMANGCGQDYLFKLGVPGRHFAMNALGALAAATAVGADPVTATLDLAQWTPPVGRGTRETIVLDPANDGETLCLIDDALNANPTSVATSFEVIASATPRNNVGRIVKGRRIAIIGDMADLGPQSARMHGELAQCDHIQAIDQIHCIGPQIYHLWRALPLHQRGQWAQSAADFAPHVSKLVDAGDVVLVKGAAGSKTFLVVDAIRKLGHRRPLEE
ncbi:UDP-N-acetylmuramoyl-tripeptide--D-alanyl-D-alanine ligase [Yoonia tamlensis]|uniref:UDP-N-acetylmuramoyl-tripeptide--D-alanyl-D-alanine ligase n=1 Tax=Yoonia tamlensis TaxID=390270 RepID=A0A1I6G136_9RHOB|nr:Mur ligase family protein [Yoonia tamlensis]SFR35898.1 UDP-N-acetylmuramoyl-tripeptide--D-alanyl-D-alanine ligase [Yoonia tamlensis]